MNKMIASLTITIMVLLIFMGWVVTTYKPVTIENSTGPLPKKETKGLIINYQNYHQKNKQ
jgi:hypothetical protein